MNDEPNDTPDDENTTPPGDDNAQGDTPAFTLVPPEDDAQETDDQTVAEDDDPGDEETEADAETEDEDEDDSDEEEAEEEDGEEEPTDGEETEEEHEDENGISPLPVASVVEAILFAAREPLKLAQIARAVGKRTRQDAVRAAIDELNVAYLETSRAFEIAEISGRFQLMSRPEYADYIMRIYPKRELTDKDTKSQRLTPAMLDTLAIVAYKQPVMRSEIEHIRGVACGPVLRSLIERGSVQEIGRRADLVGKPAVFGTTERFLAEFGLGSIEELPLRNEFVSPGAPPQVELTVVEATEEDVAESTVEDGADEASEETSEESLDETPDEEDAAEEESADAEPDDEEEEDDDVDSDDGDDEEDEES